MVMIFGGKATHYSMSGLTCAHLPLLHKEISTAQIFILWYLKSIIKSEEWKWSK